MASLQTISGPNGAWFFVPRRLEAPRLRIFCFPYAGGSATLYRDWPQHLPDDIELVGVQLPGRAFRLREPAFTDITRLLEALETQLSPYLDQVPFVFWGHSMGALVSFELMRRFQSRGLSMPKMAIVSGRRAPQLPYDPLNVPAMSDDEFMAELRRLGGTPDEVLDNERLMNLVLPSLRADFEILYRWHYIEGAPFSMPMKAVGGTSDGPIPRADLEAWSIHTGGDFTTKMFEGDHFYLHEAEPELLPWLKAVLAELQV